MQCPSESSPWSVDAEGLVVFLGNIPFHSCWQRPQRLALGLAEQGPVAYVNPNRSLFQAWLRQPATVEAGRTHERLRVLDPPAGLPFGRHWPAINRFNCRRTIQRFLQRQSRPPRAVLATFPDQWEMVRRLPRQVPLLYDVMDDFTLFLRARQWPQYRAMHERLLARAHFVLTSSQVLHARHRHLGDKLIYLGNGAAADLAARCAAAEPHPALARLPAPRLGYAGMIAHWLDFPVIRALAEAFPHGSVVLVGPRERSLPNLPANVHCLGPVRQDQLPGVLRTFDLGLIPFVPGPAIDAVNPVKLYEYLSAGLPVLASSFAEMAFHAEHVTQYRNATEAVAAARYLLAQENGLRARQGQAYALRNTWEKWVQVLSSLIRTGTSHYSSRAA